MRHAAPKESYRESFNPLPSQARGDLHQNPQLRYDRRFQSAPLTKARGDSPSVMICAPSSLFQSAPLTKARGDPRTQRLSSRAEKFQSAPLTKARGDRISDNMYMPRIVSIRSPHKSKGRRCEAVQVVVRGSVSIRSPHKSKGRRGQTHQKFIPRIVSIRSPHKSKGRHLLSGSLFHTLWFQSAPLTKARGDLVSASLE